MFKFKMSVFFIIALFICCSGCAYVNIRAPYDDNIDNTDFGSKTGTATAYSVLWIVSWGDASYSAAARNGNIRVMKHADQEIQYFLFGVFSRWSVIVYGD